MTLSKRVDGFNKADQLTLQERVRQFNLGTPTAMHTGTHELVNDLWRELEKRLENHVALAAELNREDRSSTATHTPGPWKFNPISYRNGWLEGANGKTIFHVDPDDNDTPNDADARLIEAAPDLLAALKQLTFSARTSGGVAGRDETLCAACDVAEAAIAKATGAAS